MALSFEESKKLLNQQIAAPMMMTRARSVEYDVEPIAAYSEEVWERDRSYIWFDEYFDDKISYIDENKNITIDSSQVNISQETNSQFIPFEMFRRYDGIDLTTMDITVHYTRSDGVHLFSHPVNVEYSDNKIRFVWLVDGSATKVSGNLKFEIHASGAIVDSARNSHTYLWKSKTTDKFNVSKSLCSNTECENDIDIDQTTLDDIVESVTGKVADKLVEAGIRDYVADANNAAYRAEMAASMAEDTAKNVVNNMLVNYATKNDVESAISSVDVRDQLADYALKSEIPNVPENISAFENDAGYLTEHQSLDGYATETYVNEYIGELGVDEEGNARTVAKYIQESIEAIDVSDQLGDLADAEGNPRTVKEYVDDAVEAIDVSDQLGDLADDEGNERTVKQYVDDTVAAVDVSGQLVDYAKSADVYTKTEIDTKTETMSSNISTNTTSITSLNKTVAEINQTLSGVDKSPRVTYEATYGDVEMDDGSTAEYMFTLWETEGTNQPTVKSRFQIMGGGGGNASSVTLRIAYIEGYTTPIVATVNDKAVIKYEFSGEDSAGDTNLDGIASWKVGNRVVATEDVATGTCEFDITDHVSIGDNKVLLTITHATGAVATKAWTVKVVDVRLTSDFDDTKKNIANEPVNFTFTPFGGIDKIVHFLLDGKEIATKISTAAAAGLSDSYAIPAQAHGTHLFEVYMTATINNKTVESNHIVKDIIWYDETSDVPVISCVKQEFTARQYEATNITYTVYDPSTETPNVVLKATYINEDGDVVEEFSSNLVINSNTPDPWQYKTDVIGEHILTITCGETVKTLKVTIVEIGIEVSPITAGLAFDFNPVGYSNSDQNRLWSSGDIAMSVSDNFDWVNGGYQIDDNGDQCFCIKAGTSAEINYELFGDDAKENGKQMKLIFKTENVADSDATFMSCVSQSSAGDNIGIIMKAHEATIYASADKDKLPLPYAEEEIIEFEFNITPSTSTPSMIMGYEDGVSTRPFVYNSTHNFQQQLGERKTITLGSPDCDLYIYRFKVYKNSLSDRDILNNFIADARSAEEMIARYDRNQIYKEGILDPDYLAEVCPQLRIIKIETPYFTSDKDEKIGRIAVENTNEVLTTNVECIYKGGDPILDNWVATDVVHSGQGTSSNNYGPAGRNLDIIIKRYQDKKTQQYLNENPIFTLSDGNQVNKVSLTRNSVDVNYFNIKVNIASSENANNALLAKRYNDYNPYNRPIVRETAEEIAKVKDTMEFQNCVVFIKETHPDVTKHREFNDNNWHFYAIGNIGDSKKTDDTRLTDPSDPYECILEVMDNTLPNSTMPTGKVDENGAPIYPIAQSEWTAGNSAYDSLYSDTFDEAEADAATGKLADTYGWRYIYEDGTDEENDAAKAFVENKWKEFYGFVVTATDEEFKAHLGDYCVLNSVMYYYLFTLRYTMTDNHAKNSFWHYGKTGEVDTEGNPIRKWDLCFDYDNDTSLGIDNYGRMTYRYGYEEIDYVDGTNDWVWNAPQHVFFLRLRELFDEELSALYNVLPADCWSASSLINQFNNWQMQFPEELWRLDIERKYIRTYTSSYINGKAYPEFLTERANGRKKTQRAQFEKNQEKYMASKFASTVAASDDIILRCSVPNTTLAVPANFDMHLTPYSYVYLNVKYNTSPPIKIRAVPNQEYTIRYDGEMADIIEIYSASCLKSVGDLSACYLTNGTFANATKIRELVLGNGTDGYNNTNVMTLGLGSNELLNKLDIQNMSGLTHSLELSGLKNLEELYAFGSGVSGVVFADGGNIRVVELPAVGSLTMKNLSYLDDNSFAMSSYNKLSKLVVENSLLDIIDLLEKSKNLYQVRLVGIDWNLENTSLLERLYELAGVTNTGGNSDKSVLSGNVYVPVIRQKQKYDYENAWPDLVIDAGTTIEQFAVTFVNEDGSVLDVQYVDKGSQAVDPLTRTENPINTPTKESTVSTDYTFAGWNKELVDVFENQTITATYSEATRKYMIQFMSKGSQLLPEPIEAEYGTVVTYNGPTPTYTIEESGFKYYLFDGWDQSGYVNGNKTINAIYDSCQYTSGYFDGKDLSSLRPVELYMMIKRDMIKQYISPGDKFTISLGNDFNYSDLSGDQVNTILSEPRTFTGVSGDFLNTGITLFDEDRSFVLAIEYNVTAGDTIAQCYSNDTFGGKVCGFRIRKEGSVVKCNVGRDGSGQISNANSKEMVVIRHVKGENSLHIYSSNTHGNNIAYYNLESIDGVVHNRPLVFGCSLDNGDNKSQYSAGTVYWSKVWYADLGDDVCRELACWPHADMHFTACYNEMDDFGNQEPKTYELSDGSYKKSSISFIASNVLTTPKPYNTQSGSTGGWASSDLRDYLNSRIYNAIPSRWRQLLKNVMVASTVGNNSTVTTNSNCYIFIPSVAEIYPGRNIEPYVQEGTIISHMTESQYRKCYNDAGDAVMYWTRSPFVGSSGVYICTIKNDGSVNDINASNSGTIYVRIMFTI